MGTHILCLYVEEYFSSSQFYHEGGTLPYMLKKIHNTSTETKQLVGKVLVSQRNNFREMKRHKNQAKIMM